MKATAVTTARLIALPLAFSLIGLWWCVFFALMVADFIGRAGLALAASRWWRGLGPAVAFGGGVWLALRGSR